MEQPETQSAVGSTRLLGAVVEFIKGKLADAESRLQMRVAMQNVWASGTDESWRAVGCRRTKSQRLKDAAMHGRIATKNRREVLMFKATLAALQAPNDKLRHGGEKQ